MFHDPDDPDLWEPVLLVHGTYSQDAEWWKPDSDFCRALDAEFELNGHRARCWFPTVGHKAEGRLDFSIAAVLHEPFKWSGRNSEIDRSGAADELARYVGYLLTGSDHMGGPAKRVHLIGHSHGGNIILDALARHPGRFQRQFVDMQDQAGGLKSVVLLGTPVLARRVLAFGRHLETYSSAAFVAFLLSLPTALFDLLGLRLWAIAAAVLFLCSAIAGFILQNIHAGDVPRINAFVKTRVHFLISRYDEALHLLRSAIEVRARSAVFAARLTPVAFKPILSARSRLVSSYIDLLRRTWDDAAGRTILRTTFFEQFSAVLFLLAIFAGTLPLLAVVVVDQTLVRLITGLAGVLRRRIVDSGLAALASNVLGDDLLFSRIDQISSQPGPESFEAVVIPISRKTEEAMLRHALKSSKGTLAAAYHYAGDLPVDAALLSQERLAEVLDGPDFVHCQYYARPEIAQKIARIIMQSSSAL